MIAPRKSDKTEDQVACEMCLTHTLKYDTMPNGLYALESAQPSVEQVNRISSNLDQQTRLKHVK